LARHFSATGSGRLRNTQKQPFTIMKKKKIALSIPQPEEEVKEPNLVEIILYTFLTVLIICLPLMAMRG
jgi:hypothetical protein